MSDDSSKPQVLFKPLTAASGPSLMSIDKYCASKALVKTLLRSFLRWNRQPHVCRMPFILQASHLKLNEFKTITGEMLLVSEHLKKSIFDCI